LESYLKNSLEGVDCDPTVQTKNKTERVFGFSVNRFFFFFGDIVQEFDFFGNDPETLLERIMLFSPVNSEKLLLFLNAKRHFF
jgi:hypothetical protein